MYKTESISTFPWYELTLKLLDWPFLLFLVAIFMIFILRGQLKTLVKRSSLKISWGDKSIELNELSDNLDQDIDPIKERLDFIEEALDKLNCKEVSFKSEQASEPTPQQEKKVINALNAKSKYHYRTAKGIARETKVPFSVASHILSRSKKVKVVKSRDGRELYSACNRDQE